MDGIGVIKRDIMKRVLLAYVALQPFYSRLIRYLQHPNKALTTGVLCMVKSAKPDYHCRANARTLSL